MAWSYLFAFAAWVAGLAHAGIRYDGNEVVTTPGQAVELIAMFGAAAIMARTAWVLTTEAEAPPPPLDPSPLLRLLVGTTIRWMALAVGGGFPEPFVPFA